MRNCLFVCKHNFTRSKYSAEFFRGYLEGKKLGKKIKIYSAGIGFTSIFLGKRLNHKLISKIDFIFVMEKYMKNLIVKKFDFDKNKIIVLNIKDKYGFLRRNTIEDLDKILRKIDWGKYIRKF